ncbi:hypothetical protein FNF29_02099 [Cafeteria roenbergensis]|uniref:AB hydrolase-1 domain-containing protein n=1 Tax=Cafeteria roenbergensis TaxID=33653 RepID=A0A5A8CPD7_CAFRO|nr:hypothetical protein FNF29_02099 [Cafeteria roenbergensis]|eukprot:KAA0154955.1 hypothetical protein FNF29_02099 [Cafeteria roenbergensis]
MRQSGKLAPFESYAGHVPGVFGRLVTSPWLLLGLYLAANLVALILTGVVELFALMLTLPGLVVATLVLAVLVARLFMRGAAYPGSMVLVKNSMEADCSRDVAKEVFSAAVHAEAALAEAGVATSCRAAAASLARAGFGAAAPPTSVSSGRCPAGAAAATLRHVQTVLSAQLAMSDAVRDTDVGRRSAVGAPAEAVAGETSTPFARRMLHELALAIAGLTAISSESRRLAALAASVEWTEALTSPLAPEAAEAGIAAVCPRPRPTAAIVAVTEEPEPGEAAAAAAAANERVLASGSLTPHARLRFLELRAGQGALERATVAAINQLLTGSSATPGVGGGSSAGAASAAAPTVFDVIAATSSRLRSLQRASVWMSKAGGGAGGGGAGAWGNVAVVDLDPTEGVGAGGRRPPVQGTHMAELPNPSSEAAGAGGGGAPAPGLGSDMDTWEDAEDETAAEELLSSMEAERSVQESRRRRGSGAEGAGSERPRTADNEPEEGGGGGGGIISTITALPSMSVRLATQLANAWARRNAPGPVGGFGFQRVEMLLAHDGWTVTLDQEDGAFVDAAVLPFRRSTPCPDPGRNPNGGLYELWHRWSESLELYLSNGFTVIVYNYRGYGRSTGAPSPGRCTADAEALVRYARRHLGARHVLAHSESIGGIVSSRLAASGAVDGLIGDRNFDNLALTASMLMGRWAEVGMHALSRWAARSNAEAILEATCPKIILANPAGDEVIGLPASASVGVANRVADAWAEVAGPLPSPPSSPLPIDPAASSCPPGCIKACPGKRSALSPNDSLASVARRFQLALARATMACAHNLAPAEALQACAVAQDVRFPGASIRRRAASEARPEAEQSSLLVALEPEELSVRRLAVAAEDETRAGPAARPGASSARSGARPGSTASVPPLASAETDVQSLSPANASLPLFLSPRVPPTFVDADLIAACIPSLQQAPPIARDRIFSPGATTAVRGKAAEALAAAEKDASASAAGAGRAAAGLELDLELLRETAFPGISVAAEAMLRAFRGDVPAAIVAALCSGQTAAGPTLTVLQGDLLSHPAAAPGFFALHTVYSMAWAVESGADAADTTASGQVPLWARPASQAARLACGLPLRPDSAWAGGARAGPGALLAAPADPGAPFPDGPSLSTAGPIPSTSLVGVMALPTRLDQLPGGGALAPGAQHASLHASVALASVISERLHPTAVERGDPGAKEAMQALSAARRIVEIAEWIALRGGPRAQLDAALARGTLPRDGPATGWRMLASRALRPEGVLITLEGRGHNMAWRRNHVAMIRDCGQRLGWWPTGKFVDDAAPDAAPPSPAETTAGADSPIDAHEVMLEA